MSFLLNLLAISRASLICGSWSMPTGITVGIGFPSNSFSWGWYMSDAWRSAAMSFPGVISP